MAPMAWCCLAGAVLLLQPKLALFNCPLNLTLALVYSFGIKTASHQPAASGSDDVAPEIISTIFGAGIGLIEDVLTGSLIGPNLLSKGLAGFISSIVYREIFFRWESVLGGVVLAVLTLLDGLVVIGARELFSSTTTGGPAVVELVIIQSVMNIPLGLLVRAGQKASVPEFRWFHGRKYN